MSNGPGVTEGMIASKTTLLERLNAGPLPLRRPEGAQGSRGLPRRLASRRGGLPDGAVRGSRKPRPACLEVASPHPSRGGARGRGVHHRSCRLESTARASLKREAGRPQLRPRRSTSCQRDRRLCAGLETGKARRHRGAPHRRLEVEAGIEAGRRGSRRRCRRRRPCRPGSTFSAGTLKLPVGVAARAPSAPSVTMIVWFCASAQSAIAGSSGSSPRRHQRELGLVGDDDRGLLGQRRRRRRGTAPC